MNDKTIDLLTDISFLTAIFFGAVAIGIHLGMLFLNVA